ncbi:MAG TPA: DUF1800 domain-containing protein [Pyrinomonadaceae bacterium]|nr:DUF1800 domain-containing protein [Pyrinomonadaceae bacterium]
MNRSLRKFTVLLVLASIAAGHALASPARKLTEEQRIIHVLNRLGFGARPGDVQRVKAMGLENYINQQLAPEKIDDSVAENKVKDLGVLNMTTAELYEKYPQPGRLLRKLQERGMLPNELAEAREKQKDPLQNENYRKVVDEYYRENGLQRPQRIMAELQASRILRAVYSERQLQEVMVDFWTNHFNVFSGKGADRWLLPAYDRDTIRPHALAKFSTLLQATAQSPAMLFYLDNFQSVSPNMNRPRARMQANAPAQQPRRGINENYARELMELHTLGVDGGYTQKDVQEVARCFTGWTIFQPRGGAAAVNALRGEAARRAPGTFFFNPRTHDDGEKIVLGHKIPAGGGFNDGLKVLDILARHPSTAKFIATKLVRHFVSDTPPPALVKRVAEVFTRSDGDIRETLKAIFFSSEFNSPEAYRAKVKRPFELVVSAIRTLGADTNGGPGTHQWIARMGEPLYGFQTPNGYSDAAESWVNTGGLLERMNFGLALAGNRVQGTKIDLTKVVRDNGDKSKLVDESLKTILAGEVSASTRETLLKQLDQNDPASKVVGLILGTPEFQRQ